MAYYNPTTPPLILIGNVNTVTPKDLYGVSDGTGLSNTPVTYTVNINSISPQVIGDESIRSGTDKFYNGIDVKVGDFIAQITGNGEGRKVFKIIEITLKKTDEIICVIEDIDMFVARSIAQSDNELNLGESVIIFEVNEQNQPILYNENYSFVTLGTYTSIISYFNTYNPLYSRRFFQDPAPNFTLSDNVTVNTSGEWVKATSGDTILGQVSKISTDPRTFYVRPTNKIIDNFEYPQGLTGGSIGDIWYSDPNVDGGYTTTKKEGSVPLFFQISDAVPTTVIATSEFTLSSGQEIVLNNVTGATGVATQSQVVSQINNGTSQHHVVADEYSTIASDQTDVDNIQFSQGPIVPNSTINGGNDVDITISDGTNSANIVFSGTGNINIGTGESGTPNGFAMQDTTNGDGVVTILNNAFSTNSVNVIAEVIDESLGSQSFLKSIKLSSTVAGETITITTNVGYNTTNFADSGTTNSMVGVTNLIEPEIQNALRLTRNDGGDILITGTAQVINKNGMASSSNGNPPLLVVISGGNSESGTSGSSGTSGTSGNDGTSGSSGTSGTSGNDGTSGSSGTSGTSGVDGTSGSSGTSGTSGNDGTSGSSGTSGTSGVDGIGLKGSDGTSGTSGTSGVDGTSGSSGTSGTSGNDGTSGSSGTSGTSGNDGTSGSSGTSGTSGVDGTSGSSGTSGTSGNDGTSGSSGTSGTSGNDGTSGSSGTSGTSGNDGTSGSSGTSGTSGNDGTSGSSGTSGTSGNDGTSGSSGTSGTSGNDGTSGSSGTSGTSGNDGTSGSSGTSGTSGVDGTSGSSGTSGTSGNDGTSGSSGTSGTSGSSGSSGRDGISAGRIYYFNQTETQTPSTYQNLSTTASTASEQIITSAVTDGGTTLISEFITDELGFTLIPGGVQTFHLYMLLPQANADMVAYSTLELADSTGTGYGTVLTTNETQINWIDETSPVEVLTNIIFPSTVVNSDDRMIVKIYVENLDSTNHDIKWYTEGSTHYSFVTTTIGVDGGINLTVSANTGVELTENDVLYTIYNSTLSSTLEMDSDVGGIDAGTTVADLTGKTFVDLFNDLLFPTVLPTYTIPTISFVGSPSTSTVEVGSTVNVDFYGKGIKNDAGNFTTIRLRKNGTVVYTDTVLTTSTESTLNNDFGYLNPNNPNSGFTSDSWSETLTIPAPSVGTETTTRYDVNGDYEIGLVKKDNKGNDDTRSFGNTVNTPQAARNNFDTGDRVLTGIYPYFWGKSSTEPTIDDIKNEISGGTANKVISKGSSNIVINYNASDEFIWFAVYSGYNNKTTWTVVAGSNDGTIGEQFISSPVENISINGPVSENYWSSINYDIYVSAYATTLTTSITFS
jgi:hypothetical protein